MAQVIAADVDIESLLDRARRARFPEMPFSDEARLVSGGGEQFTQCDRGAVESRSVRCCDDFSQSGWPTIRIADGVDSVTGRVLSGHQRRAGGRAVGAIGKGLGEDHTGVGDSVDIRCFKKTGAVEAHVAPPEVVDIDENHIGEASCGRLLLLLLLRARTGAAQGQQDQGQQSVLVSKHGSANRV